MAVNQELVRQRNIPAEDVEVIELIHDHLEYYLTLAFKWPEARDILQEHFTQMEYLLQELWGFDKDSRYHTWSNDLRGRFREIDYLGVTYLCKDSFQQRTVGKENLHSSTLFSVGKGFIDFGGYNVRIVGNLERLY